MRQFRKFRPFSAIAESRWPYLMSLMIACQQSNIIKYVSIASWPLPFSIQIFSTLSHKLIKNSTVILYLAN